jgi:hypothetical protein
MKTNYKSIPIVASVIGSKSRKAMYIVHPTNVKGTTLYKDKWIPTQWGQDKRIKWEYHSQSFVEFPMSKATQAMMFESYDLTNISRFNTKLVDGKPQQFYELIDRYIIHVPVWLINSFEVQATRVEKVVTDNFDNDDNPESIIEQIAKDSHIADKFSYRGDANDLYMSEFAIEDSQSLQQWDSDNPDYS